MSVLSERVLVLNKNWMPVDVTDVYEAVCMAFRDRARFVDPETYVCYDFESWVDTWEDAIVLSKLETSKIVGTPNFSFRAPDVVVLTEYGGDGDGKTSLSDLRPKFSRRNIYLRDHNTCQYCGKTLPTEGLNLDHVVPRSKGGQMTWTNIVLSCVKCNDKKRDRLPAEAGMRLIRRPVVPKAGDIAKPFGFRLKRKLGLNVPKTWEQFLGRVYWDIGLKDD